MDETRWDAIRERLLALVDEDEEVVGFVDEPEEEEAGGRPTGREAIVVFVREKQPLDALAEERWLPDEIEGVPVDVRTIGDISFADEVTADAETATDGSTAATGRFRPLVGGCSSAAATPTNVTGTLGYFVKDVNNYWYALSCAHAYGTLPPPPPDDKIINRGPAILQPAPGDGGTAPYDQIGTLANSILGGTVDAAIALLDVTAEAKLLGLPSPADAGAASKGMSVAKSGRTTGVTHGKVVHTNMTIEFAGYTFHEVIGIQSKNGFTAPGDSGSLVVRDSDSLAVGLFFARSTGPGPYPGPGPPIMRELFSFACPITAVLDALNVRLVSPGEVYN